MTQEALTAASMPHMEFGSNPPPHDVHTSCFHIKIPCKLPPTAGYTATYAMLTVSNLMNVEGKE